MCDNDRYVEGLEKQNEQLREQLEETEVARELLEADMSSMRIKHKLEINAHELHEDVLEKKIESLEKKIKHLEKMQVMSKALLKDADYRLGKIKK